MTYITGICRAYTDYIIQLDDESELEKIGLGKGGDNLVDLDVIKYCLSNYKGQYFAGGPTANSISVIAALGGKSAFIGKVANDEPGQFFRKSFNDIGVKYTTAYYDGKDKGSGICIIFVTPDGQRSMIFNRGCNNDIIKQDIIDLKDIIINSSIIFIGFPIRHNQNDSVFEIVKSISMASKIATSLQSINEMKTPELEIVSKIIINHANIIFGNEDEFKSLFSVYDVKRLSELSIKYPEIIFIETLGENGSVISSGSKFFKIPNFPTKVVDTTGAGDAYAGGFLYGLQSGKNLEQSGRIGSYCSSMIISQIGARPQTKIILPKELR